MKIINLFIFLLLLYLTSIMIIKTIDPEQRERLEIYNKFLINEVYGAGVVLFSTWLAPWQETCINNKLNNWMNGIEDSEEKNVIQVVIE